MNDESVVKKHLEIKELLIDLKTRVNKYHGDLKCNSLLIDDIVVFGGYVRDVVAGYKNSSSDVDVYFDVEFSKSKVTTFCYSLAKLYKYKYETEYYNLNQVRPFRYDFIDEANVIADQSPLKVTCKKLIHNDLSSSTNFDYHIINITLNNIKFDLVFPINSHNTFKNLYDFTCNTLYYSVYDEILKSRLEYLDIDICVDDIKNRRLVNITKYNHIMYKNDIYMCNFKDRNAKMVTYGYINI